MLDKIMEGRIYDLAIYHFADLRFDSGTTNATLGLYLRYLMVDATGKTQTAAGLWSSVGTVVEGKMRDLIRAYAEIK